MAKIFKAEDVFKPLTLTAEQRAVYDAKYANLVKWARRNIILGEGDVFNLGLDNVR